MKKLQNLGKSLSKDEQRKINGGANNFKVTCYCNDGTNFTTCQKTCALATSVATSLCAPHLGTDACTNCVANCVL